VPDAATLESIAGELRTASADSILSTTYVRDRATLLVDPTQAHDVVRALKESHGYTFLASLHGDDYYPEEPRLGVLYESRRASTSTRPRSGRSPICGPGPTTPSVRSTTCSG
jgi:NADH:ubiquinone oxidoreductase subunit C